MTPPTGLGPCAPAGPRKNRILRPRSTQILEKIARCARQARSVPQTIEIRISPLAPAKVRINHAKTTYSFIYFSSRHGAKR